MELNLFKHHYFVTVTFKWIDNKKACMFIHCRAKDVEKNILSKIYKYEGAICIETVTKLD